MSAAPAGRFVRSASVFRELRMERPAADRYHLYVCSACPWAHRTVIVRKLKRLEGHVGLTGVDPIRDERGWRFTAGEPDPVNGWRYLAEGYLATDPSYAARVTVPVLWDREEGRILNNESADIVRMLNAWSDEGPDLYPADLRDEIDDVNDRVYEGVNDGVYKVGFATTQEAYDEAFDRLFATLDWLDERLATRRWLVGDRITEADWRLFPTLVRFDAVYVGHFRCNLRRIADYPALGGYLRDLYQQPGIAETVDFEATRRHYFLTHPSLNPSGIVPKGPALDLDAPPGRDHLD